MKAHMLGLALLAPLLMAGQCSDRQATAVVCPRIKQYSADTQARALAELDLVEKNAPTISLMFGDYLALRDAVRACVKAKGAAK